MAAGGPTGRSRFWKSIITTWPPGFSRDFIRDDLSGLHVQRLHHLVRLLIGVARRVLERLDVGHRVVVQPMHLVRILRRLSSGRGERHAGHHQRQDNRGT